MTLDYDALVERLRHGAPFADLIGAVLVGVGPGTSEVRMARRDDLVNAGGTLHAGALFGVADVAAGAAVYGLMATVSRLREVALVTAGSTISYRRPARGDITARAGVAGDPHDLLAPWPATGKVRLTLDVAVTSRCGAEDDVDVATAEFDCVVLRRHP